MEKCSTWNILSILICKYIDVRNAGETALFLLDLCRQLWHDEFAPELERRMPVLFPFWKGGCCWAPNRFCVSFGFPFGSAQGWRRKQGCIRQAQHFGVGLRRRTSASISAAALRLRLRAQTRGARLRLLQTPAKRLNFAKRVGEGIIGALWGTRVTSGVSDFDPTAWCSFRQYLSGGSGPVEIESQWRARKRQQAGDLSYGEGAPPRRKPRPSGSLSGAPSRSPPWRA